MTPLEITEAVAADSGVQLYDLLADTRGTARTADARAIAVYLCRRLLGLSYPALGREFGRHHTSCLAAFERVRGNSRLLARAITLRMQLEVPVGVGFTYSQADPEEVMA